MEGGKKENRKLSDKIYFVLKILSSLYFRFIFNEFLYLGHTNKEESYS